MLAECKALPLVIGSYTRTINLIWTRPQRDVLQPSHDLAVFDQKGNFMCPNFQNRTSTPNVARAMSKTRVEKTGVMDTKLSDILIHRDHFRCPIRRNADFF